jgi:predicted RNA binding protein YcfA (HicA-like mRNA interferase family)
VHRIRASHHQLKGPSGQRVTVLVRGNKPLPVGTVEAIIEQAGLTVEEVVELL